MSVVINILTDRFSVLASDKRLVKFTYDDSMNIINTDIIDENVNKIKKINENVYIAFAGDPIPLFKAFSAFDGYNTEVLTLERIKRLYINELKKQEIYRSIQVIISGRNKNNLLTTYVISSKNNFEELCYQPKENELCRAYLLPSEFGDNNENFGEILDSLIFNSLPFDSFNDVKELAQKCVLKIADLDITVNHNIQLEVIQ